MVYVQFGCIVAVMAFISILGCSLSHSFIKSSTSCGFLVYTRILHFTIMLASCSVSADFLMKHQDLKCSFPRPTRAISDQVELHAQGRPAASHPKARRGPATRRSDSDTARDNGQWQDVHDCQRHSRSAATNPHHKSQQLPWWRTHCN